MLRAVWKDYDFPIPNVTTPLEYNVKVFGKDEEVIYTGVAKPKPGTNNIYIRLSDFAKNVCNSDVEDLFDEEIDLKIIPDYYKMVGVKYINGTSENNVVVDFYNSYNYNSDFEFDYDVYVISNPITTYSSRGLIMITIFNNTDEVQLLDLFSDERGYLLGPYEIEGKQAVVFKIKNLKAGSYTLGVNGVTDIYKFKTEDKCNRYNLHYLNADGAYDTLPIEGLKDKRTDNFDFSYYKSRGNNQNECLPQMNKFQTNITTNWQLQTSWLNDEQSLMMYNLFGSHKVWLEDTETDKLYPVYITNKSLDYKTYTNNGKRKISYTISITSSNTLIKF